MAAKRGTKKDNHRTGKRSMSRATKIRKRIFGVTSLILAVLVANIPTTSRAALVGSREIGPFRLSMTDGGGTWSATKDVAFEIDSESKNPNDGSTPIDRYITVEKYTDSTLEGQLRNKLANDIAHGPSGTDHTAIQMFSIKYYKDAALTQPFLPSDVGYTDWKEATLELGIVNLKNVMNFRDFYWTNSLQTLKDQYGAQLKIYAFRDYFSGGTDGWFEAEGYQTYEGSGGYWGSADMIAAGYRHDASSNRYRVTHLAIAYRAPMNIDYASGTLLEQPDRLMAACFYAADAGGKTIKFKNVDGTSGLRGAVQTKLGKAVSDNAYYEFNMRLVNTPADDTCIAGGSNIYAVSVPLPSYMDAPGTHATGNYSVFRKVADGQSASSVIPINEFDVVERDGVMTLQFTVTYNHAIIAHNPGGEDAYPNDFGVVFDSAVPVTGDPKIAAYPSSAGGGTATMTVGGSARANDSTVPVNTSVMFTATPANSNYTFTKWSSNSNGTGSVSTDNPYTTAVTADTTLYAVFSYNGGGGGGGITPPSTYQLTVVTNPTGGGTTSRSSGPVQEGAISISATPAEHFYFGKWDWDLGNDGVDTSFDTAEMTATITADSTATAYFYTLKYFDDRTGALSNYSTDPYRATLVSGKLLGNAELHVKGPTVDGDTVLQPLTETRYGASSTLYRSYDYFSLSLTPDSSVVGSPYTISINKMALPSYMDTSLETGGDVDLWYHDTVNAVMREIGDDKLTVHPDGTITFTIDETTSMGNYVLVWSTVPTLTVQDARSNPAPLRSAEKGEIVPTTPPANRTLVIKDYTAADDIYSETAAGFTDNGGNNIVPADYDGFAIVNSELVGLVDEKNPGLGTHRKTDMSKMTFMIPYDLGFTSNAGKLYQITGTPGAYSYSEVNSSWYDINDGTVTFKGVPSSMYNADYVILFSRTMEFRVRDQRIDKPAQASSSTYETTPEASTTQTLLPEDRYVIIENISPEANAAITTAIHNTAGYEDWTVIPYEIRYVDGAGVDKDDYTPIPLHLTIPERAKGKYRILLASLDENGASPVLYLPETSATWGANDEYVDFVASHFSEYALLYQETAPVPDNSVKVIQAESVPAAGGGYGGAGTYQKGDTVTLTAYPAAGYDISYWTAVDSEGNQTRLYPTGTDANGNKTTTFQITRDQTVSATFDPAYTIRAFADPATGNTVTVDPVSDSYAPGTTVVLQANKAADWWEDNGVRVQNGGTIYTIPSMDANHIVVAHFADAVSGSTSVTPSGGTSGGGTTGGGTTPSGTQTIQPQTVVVQTPSVIVVGDNGGTQVSSAGKNANDMPRTGMEQATVYKMIGAILLTLFGAIELLSSTNMRKRRAIPQS